MLAMRSFSYSIDEHAWICSLSSNLSIVSYEILNTVLAYARPIYQTVCISEWCVCNSTPKQNSFFFSLDWKVWFRSHVERQNLNIESENGIVHSSNTNLFVRRIAFVSEWFEFQCQFVIDFFFPTQSNIQVWSACERLTNRRHCISIIKQIVGSFIVISIDLLSQRLVHETGGFYKKTLSRFFVE